MANPSIADVLDQQLLEMRWRCLSLAADLDRLDRHAAAADPRVASLREAMAVLLEDGPGRAERVQMILSDVSPGPMP